MAPADPVDGISPPQRLDPDSSQWVRVLSGTGPQHQAAADALLAIDLKLGQFRGESRFTTWAYKFVIFEVSAKIGRHFWAHPAVPMDGEDWDRLPGRLGPDPAQEAERRELADASAAQRYPGITAHLAACGPCGEDFDGLLAAIQSPAQ